MPNGLKQFGEKGTGLLSGQFHHARVRLTWIYVTILTAILFFSSYTIYSQFSNRLQERFHGFQPGFQHFYQPPDNSTFTLPSPEDVQGDLIHTLYLVNSLLLVGAGLFSYWLAGVTLQPIQAAYKRQQQFLGDASHELRTPLAILQTDLENELEDNRVKGSDRQRAQSQLEEVVRMGNLVHDLLTLSRLDEEGERKPNLSPLNLNPLLIEAVGRLEVMAKRNQVKLEYGPLKEELIVMADAELLLQIFTNLIKNAILYNKEGGSVVITTGSELERAWVTITDDGIGISKEDIDKISQRFYRVDKSRSRQTGGSGLGLSIVQSGLDQLNGSMSIESRQGRGTTVKLTFPLA